MTQRRSVIAGLAALPLIGLLPRGMAFAQAAALDGDTLATASGDVTIHPIHHASLIIAWGDQVVYVDPVGGPSLYQDLPSPTAILITHAHGDHFDPPTLEGIVGDATILTTDQVLGKLPADLKDKASAAANGDSVDFAGIKLEVVPAYNTTQDRLQYHPKGVGNGYILNIGDKRVYVAGDTEDIPEMRALTNIDMAFIPMNLPYTMDINQAAGAIKAFKPKIVYPYHYQGTKVEDLPALVGDAAEVRLRDWYKES